MRKTLFFSLLFTLGFIAVPTTFATTCTSTTDCTFSFDEHNSSFSGITLGGPYGTVELTLVGSTIHVNLQMNPDLVLIDTGFPGTFGFNDTLGDTNPFTASNFSSAAFSGSANNGGVDTVPPGPSSDLHFGGFGYFDDAAGTTGPHPGTATNSTLTFTLSRTGGFTSVQQLLETPSGGGDGSPYFVADVFDKACGAANPNGACTGLVGVGNLSQVPEPRWYVGLLGLALAAMAFIRFKRAHAAQPTA